MHHYKLVICYNGSRYLGWQKQKDFHPTIQGELDIVLERIFKSNQIHSIGAGRTDAGVHALKQVVKISTPFRIENFQLLKALNSQLPTDIKVLSVFDCEEGFRPTYDAVKKKYLYLFTTQERSSPFQLSMMSNFRFELDFELMHQACQLFIGEHDFKNFSCVGSNPSTTVRTIYSCELVTDIVSNFEGVLPAYHRLEIVGNGFLKQMVRLIMGTLWHVGRGRVSLDELKLALSGKELNHRIGEVAPSCGLYKAETWY